VVSSSVLSGASHVQTGNPHPGAAPDAAAHSQTDGQVITDKTPLQGRVGADLTTEQGKECARAVGLNILSTVRATLGSLDKVKRLVKTLGMVNCTADYKEQPQVINGFSELMAEVFGEDAGVGVRSAVGMGSLPNQIPVEIECQFEVTT
jgi:hypothetical protein